MLEFWSKMSEHRIFGRIWHFSCARVWLPGIFFAPTVNTLHGKIVIFAVRSADLRSG